MSTETQQDCAMNAAPQSEHRWLQQLVGEWAYEAECPMGPDKPMMKMTGTESVRTVGDLWIVGESKGEMPGGEPATMILTLGFDPKKGRFVGTWVGSMTAYLWVYSGSLDASGKTLTLETEGPLMGGAGDKMTKYKDITEVVSKDHRRFRSEMLGEDGQWITLVTMDYRRTK